MAEEYDYEEEERRRLISQINSVQSNIARLERENAQLQIELDNAIESGQIAVANRIAHLHILKDVLELGRFAVVLPYVAVNELRHLIQFFFIHPLHKRLTKFDLS